MHLPRAHRADAPAVAGQLARGIIDMAYCPTQDQADDVGTERFDHFPSWAKVNYLVQVVAPTSWAASGYGSCAGSLFDSENALPIKPGGGPQAEAATPPGRRQCRSPNARTKVSPRWTPGFVGR
eukprot:1569377-Pyramimonas_sp.AAC.1